MTLDGIQRTLHLLILDRQLNVKSILEVNKANSKKLAIATLMVMGWGSNSEVDSMSWRCVNDMMRTVELIFKDKIIN